MKTIIRLALFFAFAIHLHLLLAAVPLRWTVETSRVQPAQFEAYHGEAIEFAATMQTYGKPLAITNDLIGIYWQTNGMGSAYWTAPAVLSNNVMIARWESSMDVGASVYSCFIGCPGEIYRAAFQLRLRPAPGAVPAELPLPVKTLDYSQIQVLNPPYYTRGETDARISTATNAIRRVDGAVRPLPPYLHALDFDDAYPEDAAWYYAQPQDYGQCSSVRDGNSFARNYDWKFDRAAEFVVRMSAGPGRFASVGVANCGTNLTEEIATGGKWSRYFKCLPGRMVDGINENGVVANVNVVSGVPSWQTGDGLHPLAAVRWVLDNATSAASAAQHLAEHIRFPAGWTQNFHWMIADATETWIVENGAAHKVTGRAAMTNFPLYPTRRSGEGQERYDALMGGSNITSQWWTLTYTPGGYRASDLPGIDSNLVFAAWASKPRESHRGETFGDVAWWQTVHTSVYDITNRTLRIAVQERDDWYVFSVPQGGKVKSVNGQTGDVVLAGEDVISDLATIRSGAAAGATAVQPSAIADMETQTHAAANYVPFANTTKTAVKIGGLNTAQSTDGGGTIAIGRNTRALADSSFAGGHRAMTAADTKYAFAFGNRNYAPTGATALGYQAWAASAGQFANDDSDVVTGLGQKHKYSFVWQGKDDSNPGYYHSHGDGTFNVNPIGGLAGFWIGSTSLQSLLNAKQPTITDLATIRSGAAAGATAVQPSAISDMETKTHAAATYQFKGNYLTIESDPTVPSWAKATSKPSYSWPEIGSKPTVFPPSLHGHAWGSITNKPTTLADYGITDAIITDRTIRLGSNSLAVPDPITVNSVAPVSGNVDVKEIYNSSKTMKIDGNGDVYLAEVNTGGTWRHTNGAVMPYDNQSGAVYSWRTADGRQSVSYNSNNGKVSVTGNNYGTIRTGLNPLNGDDLGNVTSGVNIVTFTKQQAQFPTEPTTSLATTETVDGKISTHNSSTSAHSDIRTALDGKQATISDLATIRTGAAAGATAVQPAAISDMETKTHAAAAYQPIGNYLTTESDPTVDTKLAPITTVVNAWQTYWDGDDVRVTVTNYYGSQDLPSLYIEQKITEGGTNYYKTIWTEKARLNVILDRLLQLEADVDTKADRAWGFYDSHSGSWAPDGFTSISSGSILVSKDMSYQKTVTSAGEVWVLTATDPTVITGTETNGFFRISDSEGNSIFEVVKGDKRTVPAIFSAANYGNSSFTVTFNVVSSEHPTIEVCDDLREQDWIAEGESEFPATVAWSGASGAWVATFTGIQTMPQMFIKGSYETGGETYARHGVPLGFDRVVIGGVYYRVAVETVNGKKLMVLTEL